MKTKLIPFVLAATMCLGLLTGCQSSELHSRSEDAAKESAAATENTADTSGTTKDYSPAYAAYAPDEVMLTVNGTDVTWSELFYWYYFAVNNIESQSGDIKDWDAEYSAADGKTYRDYIKENSLEIIKQYTSLENKAKDMGVKLTEEDEKELKTTLENNIASAGGEKAYNEYLEKNFLTKELYDRICKVNILYKRVFDNMFGEKGEKLSADEVIQRAAEKGYVRAKHILILTQDDTQKALPDDQKAAKKATADKLLAELKKITDKTKLEARFDELIKEYGEDPGMQSNPEGYTFIAGSQTMDSNFDAATAKLGDFELSDIVETAYGYHIILRLPLKTTAAVFPAQTLQDVSAASLSYVTAQEEFVREADSWAKESKIEETKSYEKMDIGKVFSKAKSNSAAG